MLRCLNQLFMYSFRAPSPATHFNTTQEQGNCVFLLNQCSPLTAKYEILCTYSMAEQAHCSFLFSLIFPLWPLASTQHNVTVTAYDIKIVTS